MSSDLPSDAFPDGSDTWDTLYGDLRRLAARLMADERPGHTLQATALVNEAWLRLGGEARPTPSDRAGFLRLATRVIRNVLVDHARGKGRVKRGAGRKPLSLDAIGSPFEPGRSAEETMELDEAIERLAELDQRQASIVELSSFGGLTQSEIAETLGVSVRTVGSELRAARAWLASEFGG